MRRRLFTTLSFLSLLSCMAVMAMWVMSCVAPHTVVVHKESDVSYEIGVDRGAVGIDLVLDILFEEKPWIRFERSVSDAYEPELGLSAELLVPVRWATKPGTGHDLVVALWPLVILFGILPARWVWIRARRGRGARGFEVETGEPLQSR